MLINRSNRAVPVVLAVLLLNTAVFLYFKHTSHSLVANTRNTFKTELNIGNDTNPIYVKLQSPLNDTLGFQSIQYINIPWRFDYDDAMTMQSLATDFKVERFMGVTTDEIHDKGLAPSSRKAADNSPIADGPLACFRSHQNLWRKIVDENLSTVLIMEADATWDVNLKESMQRYAAALDELLKTSSGAQFPHKRATENDPYNSENWDILHFSPCFEGENHNEDYLIYDDPYAQDKGYYWGIELKNQRVVRRNSSPVCTTAYAISQRGARKLLLRASLDYSDPVDVMISSMVRADALVSYGCDGVMFAQWEYVRGIGAAALNSDIDTRPEEDESDMKNNWLKVHQDQSIWRINYMYEGGNAFKKPAFLALKDKLNPSVKPADNNMEENQ